MARLATLNQHGQCSNDLGSTDPPMEKTDYLYNVKSFSQFQVFQTHWKRHKKCDGSPIVSMNGNGMVIIVNTQWPILICHLFHAILSGANRILKILLM